MTGNRVDRARSAVTAGDTKQNESETNTATFLDTVTELQGAATSRFSPYPACHPSGVSWLGEIPQGWQVKRLRFAAKTNPSNGDTGTLSDSDEVSFVPMEALHEYGGMTLEQTRPISAVQQGYTHFRDGDIVVAKITPCFENGKGSVAEGLFGGVGFGTTELHVVRASAEVDQRFLFYVTISDPFRKLGTAEMYGAGGQKRVPDSFVKDFRTPLPPLQEQQAIAASLDREMASINSLVTKKRRLIELLTEKRTALISHAVTKGLNPDVPMTPTGVDWLGEVPAHWEIRRLRHIAAKLGVGLVINPSTYVDDHGTVPFFFGSDVDEYQLCPNGARRITEESNAILPASRLRAGDIVTVRVGDPGVSAVVPPELDGSNCASIMISRGSPTFDSRWLCYVLNSAWGRYQVYRVAYGAAQKQFNIGHAVNFTFPVPPLGEQRTIADTLDAMRSQYDRLLLTIAQAIQRLTEYRSALISAAVMGKIDVRAVEALG